CREHSLGRGTIIQIFYHGLDKATQAILDAGGIFLYKTRNEAHRLLKDRVLLKLDWSKDIKAKALRKTVAFAESSGNSQLMEKICGGARSVMWEFLKMKKPTMPTKDIEEEDIEVTTMVEVPKTGVTVNQEMTTEISNLEKTTLPIHRHPKRNLRNLNSKKPRENS
nr:reverse transcriptase domain-containing protein [Tanacetum cinerariifolium]